MPIYSKEAKKKHNRFMTELYDYVNEEAVKHDYTKFRNRLKTVLPPLHISVSSNIHDIIDQLEKKGKVAPGNYGILKELFVDVDQRWVEKIEEFEAEIGPLLLETSTESAARGEPQDSTTTKRSSEEDSSSAPAIKKSKRDEPDSHVLCYTKEAGQKGLMVVINFTRKREGSGHDAYKLENFFKETLNFEVIRKDDPTKENLQSFLSDMQSKINTLDARGVYFCLIVVVMSHGDKDGIITHDNMRITMDEIVNYFKNDKAPCFADRPKLFLVQACRGSDEQGTVDVSDDWPSDIDEVVGQISVPTDADILITHATTPGYKAYRKINSGIGAWFIHAVIEVFKSSYTKEHVEEMLISVRGMVAHNPQFKTIHGKKQMPCTWSTLTKRLFLQ